MEMGVLELCSGWMPCERWLDGGDEMVVLKNGGLD